MTVALAELETQVTGAEASVRPLRFPQDFEPFLAHLKVLYPSIGEDVLRRRFDRVQAEGWKCIGTFTFGDGDPAMMIAMCGFWIQHRFCYGRYLYVDHFIVADADRGRGVSSQLWESLEQIARDNGCERIVLDTFVTNSRAQRFWMNRGCQIVGLHFGKPL